MEFDSTIWAIIILAVVAAVVYIANRYAGVIERGYDAAKEQTPQWAWDSLTSFVVSAVVQANTALESATDATEGNLDDKALAEARQRFLQEVRDLDSALAERLEQQMRVIPPKDAA